MTADELDLLRSSARNLLKTAKPIDMGQALVDLGWFDVFDADPAGAVTVTAEEQGRLLAVTPILDLVMQRASGVRVQPERAMLLPAIARRAHWSGADIGGDLQVDGVVLAGHDRLETLLVLTAQGMVEVPAASLARAPVAGADPELGLTLLRGRIGGSEVETIAPSGAVEAAVQAGRRWLASELIGLADTMLAEAIAHVSARHQFGRPIASFQTVKHRLADVHVAVTAARAGVATAWSDGSDLSAMAAKCLGARAHDLASWHGHQVHGGMAFTVEYGFHRLIQRGRLLDALLGTRRDLTPTIGQACIAAGRLPRPAVLADPFQAAPPPGPAGRTHGR